MPSSHSKSRGTYAAMAAGAALVAYAGNRVYKSHFQNSPGENIDLNNQSVEIDPVEHIHRGVQYLDVDIFSYYKTICPTVKTLADVFYHGYSASNNGPCLTNVDLANKTEPLHWITYGTALERIRFIGSHMWTRNQLIPMQSKVAILSTNRIEYPLVEHACYMYGFIVVALYTSYTPETIFSILDKTEIEVIVVDNFERISSIKNQLFQLSTLKEILIMDDTNVSENNKLTTIPSVLKSMQQADVRPLPKIDPDSIATFILTSGTTGKQPID